MVSSEWWHFGKAALILATIVTTMGGIPVHVVEYTAAASAVSHAAPPQHNCAQAVEPLVVGPEATAVVRPPHQWWSSGGIRSLHLDRGGARASVPNLLVLSRLLNLVVNLLAAKLELCRQAGWWHCASSCCVQ